MILYHISFNLLHDGYFEPRVCNSRLDTENDSSLRISASKSIDGALTGMPGGNENLNLTLADQFGLMKVFKIDTEKLGISENSIIDSSLLFLKGYVPDALISQEVWITEPFQVSPEDQEIIFCSNDYEIRELMPLLFRDLGLFEDKAIPLQIANNLNELFHTRPDCQHFTHIDEDVFDECFEKASGEYLTTANQNDILAIAELSDIFFGRIDKDNYAARIHNAKYEKIDKNSFYSLFKADEDDPMVYVPIDCSSFAGVPDTPYGGVVPLSKDIKNIRKNGAETFLRHCKEEKLIPINL